MDDVVRDMHTTSGLLDELDAGMTLDEAEEQVLAYVREYVPEPRKAPLAGNTVVRDRGFLARDMPELDEHLHYRMVDVSSIKELVRRWYPAGLLRRPAKHGGHRALADIQESIEELQLLPGRRSSCRQPGPDTDAATGAAADAVRARPTAAGASPRTDRRLAAACTDLRPRRAGCGHMVGVAQLVEHLVVVQVVAGSSPVTHPTNTAVQPGTATDQQQVRRRPGRHHPGRRLPPRPLPLRLPVLLGGRMCGPETGVPSFGSCPRPRQRGFLGDGSGSCAVARWQRQIVPPMPDGGYRALRLWALSWMQTHPVLGVDADDVQLALTELVSNAIAHGSGPVDVELVAEVSTLVVNVSDSSNVMPHQPSASGTGSGGRGLLLVEKIATRWAANPLPAGGKTVWCEFRSSGPATTPTHREAPRFVVAATDQRMGAPAIPRLSDRRVHVALPEPVGVQHAIPPHVSTDAQLLALCGARIKDWVVFRHHPFTATANAACQRCAQLASHEATA